MSSSDNTSRTIVILLVEDNPGDARLTQEAMRDTKMSNLIHVVEDGVEAMTFLRREGRYSEAPRPDLILLDLNLPKKDGRAVLAEIKTDPDLKRIPVVVLTTSNAEEDVLKAYDLHANAYVSKPVDLQQFMKIVALIDEFWFNVVTLPNR
jgi:CheY-like chemotaxis protein